MARGGAFSKLSRRAKVLRSAGAWAAAQGGGDIPEGFAAVTQGGQPVTQDGEPVYVAE